MYKKIIALLLVLVLAVALVACGNNNTSDDPNNNSQNTQAGNVENENNNNNKENNDKGKTNLSQTLTFMGYKIGYPEGVSMSNSDYGQTFRFNSEIAVLIEAPSVAGVMLDVKSLDDVVSTSEEYVVKTFENTVRELFSFGATTQNVASSEKKTINGIEMLRVEGEFSNTAKNTTIAYVGYYFLLDTDPVYIVGVPMNENASADEFIDQIANSIGSKESVTAVYHGQKIKINDKERLIHLIREYAKFGNDRFLNQAINDNIINEFGKSGLKVSLVLGRNNSEISTAAFPSDAKVKKVYVLDHEYRWLVIRSDKMDAVFYLTESEIEEIYNCVDLPYEGVQ